MRPGVVTAAAVVLFVIGGLQCLVGLLIMAGGSLLGGSLGGGVLFVIGLFVLAVGGLHIFAGVKVLQLQKVGQVIGIVVAALGAVFALASIGHNPGSGVITIAADGFIIWALAQNAQIFH